MKRRIPFSIALLAVLASTSSLSGNFAHGLEINARPLVQASWAGFSSDYDPQWSGDTKLVDWRPSSSGSNVTMWYGGGWTWLPPAPSKPIELISSNRQISFTAQATVLGVTAESQRSDNMQKSGDYNWNAARFAQVLNLDGLFLAGARAVSDQQSTLSDNSIVAKGRVGTSASLHQELVEDANSLAFGHSLLSANYLVNQVMPFSLSGRIAGAGALDIEFSIVNLVSGQSLYQVKPTIAEAGRSWAFDLSGVLTPGSYRILISAASSAKSETPLAALGGIGEYELAFTAGAHEHGDLNAGNFTNGADLALWKSAFGKKTTGDLDGSGTTDGADFLIWQRSIDSAAASVALVPEPTGVWLACLPALALSGRNWRGRSAAKRMRTTCESRS